MAQLSIGGEPKSFDRALKGEPEAVNMGGVDVEALLAEDAIEEELGLPFRFGYPFDVNYSMQTHGDWETLPDGGKLWRLRIECPDAYSINLIYDYFWLPEGAEFFLYNEDRSMVLGAFTSQNNKEHGKFSTGLVQGDVCYLEYFEPANVSQPGVIEIGTIVHGYKNMFSYKDAESALGFGSSGSCNNNVNCPEGAPWQDEKRSVAMILTSSGSRICSGALVNNTSQDLTPYFLTANHCLGGESTWIFMFNYESPDCTNIDGPLWMTVSGSSLKANSSFSDFALLELSEAPPDSYEVFFAGWSAIDTAASSAVGIHHPKGDIKKISFENDPLASTSYLQPPGTGDSHWRVEQWDDGTTEPGSSGSPLFDPNHRIVGQLHGGYASCTSLTPDWYGKFSKSWNNGSTPSTRLIDWLDPGNTGLLVLDGLDGAGVSIVHMPLEDTKETLVDYAVQCNITSPDPLDPDSLILYYEINSVWAEDLLTNVGSDTYEGYIPAQPAGTTINYYLFAKNTVGDADTTETYSFYIIDYDIILSAATDSSIGAVDDTLWYEFTVYNNGVFSDDLLLTTTGSTWPTDIFDESGTTQISSTGTLAQDDSLDFKVRVIVPASNYGDADQFDLVATSTGNPLVSKSLTITTLSAGQPITLPFLEMFPTTTLNTANWVYNYGAEINSFGLAEPSDPYSVNFNGDPSGSDTLVSQAIDLEGESNVILRYYYQQTGDGESPDTDDDLFIDYLDSTGNWYVFQIHPGSDPDDTEFNEVEVALPGNAYHSGFRIRIRNEATSGNYDDWFVDDIYVGYPSNYDPTVTPGFQTQNAQAGDSAIYFFTIHNEGALDDSYDLIDSIGDWAVTFFDEAGTSQITSTPVVTAMDSIKIMAKVEVPAGTPLHVKDTSIVYIRSQGDPFIKIYTTFETESGGFAADIPWFEPFSEDTLRTQEWFTYSGIDVSTQAFNEPSPPYALKIDGGPDTAVTRLIDLDGKSDVLVSYYYQAGGGGAAPGVNENLIVEYKNDIGAWSPLNTHLGNDSLMEDFEYISFSLNSNAYHSGFQIRFRSSGQWSGGDWFIDNIRVDYAPEIVAATSGLYQLLMLGDSAEAEIILDNNGQGTLMYTLDVIYNFGPQTVFGKLLEAGLVEPASREHPEEAYPGTDQKAGSESNYDGIPVKYNAGGPDDFGYYWIDSDEAGGPSFNWVNITTYGTDIIGQLDDDNYVGPFNLGFDFEYYGQTYSSVYIGSNGIIGFDEASMADRTGRPIPLDDTPNAILAWMWRDLDPTDGDNPGAHVYYQALSDKFVVTFQDYPEYQAGPGDVITAQVIIMEDGNILFQYKEIAPGFNATGGTIGIENHLGNDGLEVAYYTEYAHDSLALLFVDQFDWFVPEKQSGTIAPGVSDTISCRFLTSADLEEGTHTADIIIENTDPDNTPLNFLAELELYYENYYICGDANSDSLVNISDAVFIVNYVFVGGSPAPEIMEAADVNCDVNVDVSDAVYLINHIFVNGSPAPCENCQ